MSILLVALAKPVVVQVQEGSGGVSIESILVFSGGVLAATAAVVAALITTRGASSRLEQQLVNERERFDGQLAAEAKRFEEQLAHERYLAQRSEASASVEQIARSMARNGSRITRLVQKLLRAKGPDSGEIDRLTAQLENFLEEIGVMAIRFGEKSPMVEKMGPVVRAMNAAIPSKDELPLGDERKNELRVHLDEINKTETEFLSAAKEVLDGF